MADQRTRDEDTTSPTSHDPADGNGNGAGVVGRIVKAVGVQNVALLVALAVLCALIRVQSDRIFLLSNILNIGVAVSILGILAVAQMVVLVSGGLDISVGSTAALSGVTVAMLLERGVGTGTAVAVAVLVGITAGAVNGFLITALSLSPIIVTLATFGAYAGVGLRLTNGIAVPVMDDFFDVIGTEELLGVPYPVWFLALFAIVTHALLTTTVIGRHIFAMGSNPAAAHNTGIPLTRYRFGIYVYAGFAAAIAGLLGVAQNGLGTAGGAGADLGLTAITAALLGGAALTGGRGSVVGAILGVSIIGVLNNGLVLVGANPYYSNIFVGVLLIVGVSLQRVDLSQRLAARQRRIGSAK